MPLPEFQRYQREFTQHIRNPRAHPRPAGVAARRMGVYNELLFNNLRGFLDACFPVCQRLIGEARWRRLARQFFSEHRCRSPLFRHIPEEFVRWLQSRVGSPALPDFFLHLAHYEWVELALDVSPAEVDTAGVEPEGDLLAGRPVLNPVSRLLLYPYAVHRISPDYRPRPSQQVPTHILAFRNPDDQVRFIVLNPVSARLVALITPGKLTGRGAAMRIARELRHPNAAAVVDGARATLEQLRNEHALLGVRPPASRAVR